MRAGSCAPALVLALALLALQPVSLALAAGPVTARTVPIPGFPTGLGYDGDGHVWITCVRKGTITVETEYGTFKTTVGYCTLYVYDVGEAALIKEIKLPTLVGGQPLNESEAMRCVVVRGGPEPVVEPTNRTTTLTIGSTLKPLLVAKAFRGLYYVKGSGDEWRELVGEDGHWYYRNYGPVGCLVDLERGEVMAAYVLVEDLISSLPDERARQLIADIRHGARAGCWPRWLSPDGDLWLSVWLDIPGSDDDEFRLVVVLDLETFTPKDWFAIHRDWLLCMDEWEGIVSPNGKLIFTPYGCLSVDKLRELRMEALEAAWEWVNTPPDGPYEDTRGGKTLGEVVKEALSGAFLWRMPRKIQGYPIAPGTGMVAVGYDHIRGIVFFNIILVVGRDWDTKTVGFDNETGRVAEVWDEGEGGSRIVVDANGAYWMEKVKANGEVTVEVRGGEKFGPDARMLYIPDSPRGPEMWIAYCPPEESLPTSWTGHSLSLTIGGGGFVDWGRKAKMIIINLANAITRFYAYNWWADELTAILAAVPLGVLVARRHYKKTLGMDPGMSALRGLAAGTLAFLALWWLL